MSEAVETITRFYAPAFPSLKLVRRPVSIVPEDGTVCLVDNGDGQMNRTRQCVGAYSGGAWTNGKGKALSFTPTYWITLDDEAGK